MLSFHRLGAFRSTGPRRIPTPPLAVALSLALLACGAEPPAKPTANAVLETKRVRAAAAREVVRAAGDEVVGTIRARSVTAVAASVMGTVRTLKVTIGSQVKAGDLLAQLSAGEIDAKLSQAQALFAQAQLELKRAEQLRVTQAITTSQYEAAVAGFRVAEAALAEAEVMRSYTTIRAPVAGVVTEKHVELGDLALPGRPLVVLESPGALRLEASVPEAVAAALHLGDRMPVTIDAVPGALEATVSELSPSADPQSRTLLVKLDLPAVDGLRAGMFGRLVVKTRQLHTVGVDSGAVVRRGQLETLFVVDGTRARLRLIRVGRDDGVTAEILAGIEPGERVVIDQASGLRDGQSIAVQP